MRKGLEEWDKSVQFGFDTNHRQSRWQGRCCLLRLRSCNAGVRPKRSGGICGLDHNVEAENCPCLSWFC